uniref:Ig-like domain-containing protein n=1 Tax=Crocodylus porosus TaxID=8502 RepID=A0A7M4FQW1_CROPO
CAVNILCRCTLCITQTPSVVLERKRTAYLRCKQNNGHENMFWYRQNPRQGQGLQFLFFFQYQEERERAANFSHFKANRAQDDVLYLNISSVEPEDSAVYFCATSPYTALQSHLLSLQKPLLFLVFLQPGRES